MADPSACALGARSDSRQHSHLTRLLYGGWIGAAVLAPVVDRSHLRGGGVMGGAEFVVRSGSGAVIDARCDFRIGRSFRLLPSLREGICPVAARVARGLSRGTAG